MYLGELLKPFSLPYSNGQIEIALKIKTGRKSLYGKQSEYIYFLDIFPVNTERYPVQFKIAFANVDEYTYSRFQKMLLTCDFPELPVMSAFVVVDDSPYKRLVQLEQEFENTIITEGNPNKFVLYATKYNMNSPEGCVISNLDDISTETWTCFIDSVFKENRISEKVADKLTKEIIKSLNEIYEYYHKDRKTTVELNDWKMTVYSYMRAIELSNSNNNKRYEFSFSANRIIKISNSSALWWTTEDVIYFNFEKRKYFSKEINFITTQLFLNTVQRIGVLEPIKAFRRAISIHRMLDKKGNDKNLYIG